MSFDIEGVAWGEDPGRWPLGAAHDPLSSWHRGVALGGQGRYASALAELDRLERDADLSSALRSLAASTRASWARQAGAHGLAARYDGRAIASVGLNGPLASPMLTDARCDALTGLAADALGRGRFSAAAALLSRCEAVLGEAGNTERHRHRRQRLRLWWVRAELAMVSGDGAAAVRHATAALALSTDTISLRHRVKTELIAAAAYSSIGDVERSRTTAEQALGTCSERSLIPLRWAAAMLLNGLGDAATARPIIDECAAVLRRRGIHLARA
ncbi:MAG: hypothetical protein WBQ44_07655 [Rhodococcus sp. (in: high G+C Gram-positive bacteria)]